MCFCSEKESCEFDLASLSSSSPRVRAADISGMVTAVRMAFLATLGETELQLRFYASPVIFFFFSSKLQLQEYLKHSCAFRIWLTALHESN